MAVMIAWLTMMTITIDGTVVINKMVLLKKGISQDAIESVVAIVHY